MKRCNVCGSINDDDAFFCTVCKNDLRNDVKSNKETEKQNFKTKPFYKSGKFWLSLIIILIALIVYNGIRKRPATYINLAKDQFYIPRTESEFDVEVDTDGDWNLTHESSWLKTSNSGSSLHIICDENNTGHNREGWITISSGEIHVSIVVVQNGFASYLKIDTDHFSVDKTGNSFTVKVDTDGKKYQIQCPNYCQIVASLDSFVITFSNNDNYARLGIINVISDNQIAAISFTQQGKCYLCGGTGEIRCVYCGGTGQVMAGVNMLGGINYGICPQCGGTGKVKCSLCGGTGIQ